MLGWSRKDYLILHVISYRPFSRVTAAQSNSDRFTRDYLSKVMITKSRIEFW